MSNVDIRGRQAYTGGGDAMVNINADVNKGLQTYQGLPPFAETQRRGDGWTVGTATLFAPLVAVPSTVAALEVYNNGLRTMVVSSLYADQILSTAATQTYAIYAMISTLKAVPTLTALSVFSLSGKAIVTPTAAGEIVTGVGTTVIANGWRPWGAVQAWGTAAATPGNSWSVEIDGRLIVPPLSSLALHVVSSIVGDTFTQGASWFELQLDLE